MLPLSRYAPGAYPPNLAFPQLGGSKVQQYFKKYDALQQNHLSGMIERKKGLREIHQARVEAQMPPAVVERGDPLEQWYDAIEGESERLPAEPVSNVQAPPEPTPPTQTLPDPTGPPEALGPRPDRMGAALRATSTGLRVVGSSAQAGLGYATAGSRLLVNAAVDAAVASAPLIQYIGDGVGTASTTVGTSLAAGAMGAGALAVEHGIPAAAAVARGVGSVARDAGTLAVEHGIPAAAAVARGAGAAVRGAGTFAVEHGIPAASAVATGSIYVGSALFNELVDILGNMPQVPAMDVAQPHLELANPSPSSAMVWSSPVNNALNYGPAPKIRQKRRGASPMAQSSRPQAPPTPVETQERPSNYVSYNSVDEWKRFSKGKGALGQQLMLRPAFVQAERASAAKGEGISQNGSRRSTAQRMKSLSADDMIHLLLKLDHK
jgi:hypothetical protein